MVGVDGRVRAAWEVKRGRSILLLFAAAVVALFGLRLFLPRRYGAPPEPRHAVILIATAATIVLFDLARAERVTHVRLVGRTLVAWDTPRWLSLHGRRRLDDVHGLTWDVDEAPESWRFRVISPQPIRLVALSHEHPYEMEVLTTADEDAVRLVMTELEERLTRDVE